jgi:hypothetical protein
MARKSESISARRAGRRWFFDDDDEIIWVDVHFLLQGRALLRWKVGEITFHLEIEIFKNALTQRVDDVSPFSLVAAIRRELLVWLLARQKASVRIVPIAIFLRRRMAWRTAVVSSNSISVSINVSAQASCYYEFTPNSNQSEQQWNPTQQCERRPLGFRSLMGTTRERNAAPRIATVLLARIHGMPAAGTAELGAVPLASPAARSVAEPESDAGCTAAGHLDSWRAASTSMANIPVFFRRE